MQITGLQGKGLWKSQRGNLWTPEHLWQLLERAFGRGDVVGCGTASSPEGHRGLFSNGLSPGHAYSVLGIKTYAGVRLVHVKNP